MLVQAAHPAADIQSWLDQVQKIARAMPNSWPKVQYRILHAFLRASSEEEIIPYEFELTCATISPAGASNNFDNEMVGHVLATLMDNAQRATKNPRPKVTHVDAVLGILLPWFEKNRDLEVHIEQRVTDIIIHYINHRGLDEAIIRVLRDCDVTTVYTHLADRLVTGRPELLQDVSKAIWRLTMLLPGPSAVETRLQSCPRFHGGTLSVIPVAPYAISVIELLKTAILNAYEAQYAPQGSDLKEKLQELGRQLVLHVDPSASYALKRAINDVHDGWALMTAVYGVLVPLPLKGLPLESMPTLPPHTMITRPAYETWRTNALEAVEHAIKLGGRLERRLDQARFAIVTEFMQYCGAARDVDDFPYRATYTFTENILRGLYIQDPPHVDSQRAFAEGLRSLVLAQSSQHAEMICAILNSSLFAGRDEVKLPWLDDMVTTQMLLEDMRTHLPFFARSEAGIIRKAEEVLGWLESKTMDNGG